MSSPFFFDPTNLLTLPTMIVNAFRYGDWKGARKGGVFSILGEVGKSAIGINTMAFFVPTGSRLTHVDGIGQMEIGNPGGYWNQARVRGLLARYGIKSWAYGYFRGEMYFRTERRQADWAQYVMMRAGVPLLHGVIPGSGAIPGPAAMAQGLPPAWADGARQDVGERQAASSSAKRDGPGKRLLRDLW